MAAPQRLGGSGAMERLHRILTDRGIRSDDSTAPETAEQDGPGDLRWHRRHRAELALKRWESATPPLYREAEAAHPDVVSWADRVISGPTTAGSLLLTGTVGSGKTHHAYGALRRIAASGPHRFEMVAVNSADMYGMLRPSGTTGSTEAEMRRLSTAPLLLLDDLGSAKASEWTEEVTYRLIDHRYTHCLPTVFTSNLPASSPDGADLNGALGERITSRLAEMTSIVAMVSEDRRKRRAS